MLASETSLEAGRRLKAARLRARLSIRNVEEGSHLIASEQRNPDCAISHSWVIQIENHGFVPGIAKLYTLSRLYNLKPEEIMAFFGLGLRDAAGSYRSLRLPHTHVVGPIKDSQEQKLVVPLGTRAAELNRTNLVSRVFENWGEIPALLQQIDLRNSILGYIGLKDYTMYPLLRPGSLVQVDSRQRTIQQAGWPNEYERPIYFVEMRDSCVCSWCHLDGSQLFLIPGPISGQQLRTVRYPHEAEIIGRVTGVVMSLVGSQSA